MIGQDHNIPTRTQRLEDESEYKGLPHETAYDTHNGYPRNFPYHATLRGAYAHLALKYIYDVYRAKGRAWRQCDIMGPALANTSRMILTIPCSDTHAALPLYVS